MACESPFDPSLNQLILELQRRIFLYFLVPGFAHISGGAPLKRGWHHDALAYELELIRRGLNRRLIVNMPPRNLKSITTSVVWVAFMLGLDPSLNFVCISYSMELASKFARDCLAIMESGWYRALFPRTIISRRAHLDFTTTAGGGRLATSIDGTLTGRGGSIIIIDDPGKPEEALSEVQRAKIGNWYRSTLLSRLDNKETGAILLIMQRTHQDDLTGQILADGQWRVLSLPAIATEDAEIPLLMGATHVRKKGDVLHPAHEPRHVLAEIEKAVGPYIWSAQYQQAPVPEQGNIVKREWLSYFDPVKPPFEGGQMIQSWDTATKDGIHNDWSACITAVIYRDRVHIVDVFRAKMTFPVLLDFVPQHAQLFRAQTLLIEDAASGQQMIQMLKQKPERGVPTPIACRPESDKVTRFFAQSSRIRSGQVLIASGQPWQSLFEEELLAFPGGKHNDQVDALSQLLKWFGQLFYHDTIGAPPEIHTQIGPEYDSYDDEYDDEYDGEYDDN